MALKLTEVVPWGRWAREYIGMFGLTPEDMNGRMLDCGGGPSCFTAEMAAQGKQVVACDPLFQFSVEEIRLRVDETYPRITALTESSKANFLWHEFGSPEQLGQTRLGAMRVFLDDYPQGRHQGRYVVGSLPDLPFPTGSFDLALCSHLLFTYTEQLSAEFHLAAILEMARVAREVRVFPLLTSFAGEPSPHLPPILEAIQHRGFTADILPVDYEFQKGGNRMLRVSVA